MRLYQTMALTKQGYYDTSTCPVSPGYNRSGHRRPCLFGRESGADSASGNGGDAAR